MSTYQNHPTQYKAYSIPRPPSSSTRPTPLFLTTITLPTPSPGPSQVLIRISAISLNYRDLLIATHSPEYPGPHKPHLIPCSDASGFIHSAHPTSRWKGKEGTKVVIHPNTWLEGDVRGLRLDEIHGGFHTDGTLRAWGVWGDERVVEVGGEGDEGDEEDAGEWASLVTAGATAWSALWEGLDGGLNGRVGAWAGGKEGDEEGKWKEKRLQGKTVLTMGTGGVSCFGIQFASALGATVIATSSSSAKLETAKQLGATHVINYTTTPNWDAEVLRLTNGKGVDQVLEVAGATTLLKSINCTRPGGLISLIGILSGAQALPEEVVPGLLFGGKILKGCVAFNRIAVEDMVKFVRANRVKPLVAKSFAFDEVVEAFDFLQKGGAVGNVVVRGPEE